MGDGYHVHLNVRRLALLSGGYRPVFSSSGWLVDEVSYDHRMSAGCFVIGSLATNSEGVFGSRKPVQQWRLAKLSESFFQLLKRERIKRQIYSTHEAARRDVFNYIEMFYNPKRRHGTSDNLSPVEYERRYFKSLTGV